eukprot:comp19681_c0_seq1/m.23354 comp19681_c0_seq1/g.23354  ORF comp19681_c0_seq1/g.23354 comp19681_c0_seq1/m.23354 type:complete len:432 (-) comp19681_c0_seq1:37-1332(-)
MPNRTLAHQLSTSRQNSRRSDRDRERESTYTMSSPGGDRKYIVAGYIAGTTSVLQLYLVGPEDELTFNERAPGELIHEQTFQNQQYATFVQVVETFLENCYNPRGGKGPYGPRVTAACFAVAGPVDSNRVTFSNRSNWVIDGQMLERQLNIDRIDLINDFVSMGYGLLTLAPHETVTIQDAPEVSGAPIACVGAGTGLGECYLTCQNNIYTAWPSEGGHCEFAPRNELEIELLQFLKSKYNEDFRVSVERIVSLRGIVNVFDFLAQHDKFKSKLSPHIKDEIDTATVKSSVVMKYADTDEVCAQTMDIVIATYGSEAGCAALKWLPYGGLYITGTFAAQNVERLRSSLFLSAYQDKGRVSPIIRQVPVKVVMVEDVGQRGAHYLAVRLLRQVEAEQKRANSILLPKAEALTSLGLVAVAAALVGLYRLLRR